MGGALLHHDRPSLNRHVRRHTAMVLRALITLVGCAVAVWCGRAAESMESGGTEEPGEEPFPIQRILLPKDRVVAELEKVKSGALIELPRAVFENRVRAAAAAARRASEPRLLETHYNARLLAEGVDENAFVGSAEWKIKSDLETGGLLSVDALQLALRQARWSDNRPAIIGLLDPAAPSSLALLVDKSGNQSVILDWSARGVPEQGQIRFDLRVPACSIATLRIEVPADLRPYFPQDGVAILEAPATDDAGKTRTWRVAFSGQSHIEVLLRPTNAAENASSAIQASSATRQDLSPGMVVHQSVFDWKSLRGEIAELLLEFDPELIVSDVNSVNLDSWRQLSGLSNGKRRVRVRFKEPMRSGQLTVAASASLPFQDSVAWVSPAISIAGSVPRSETLRLRFSPEVAIQEWKSGSFPIVSSEVLADQSLVLNLEPALPAETVRVLARPSVRVRAGNAEFEVWQRTAWDIGSDRARLRSQIQIEVKKGALQSQSFRLPAGWDIDSVEFDKDANAAWSPPSGSPPTLRLDWLKPIPSGRAQVSITLSQLLPRSTATGRATLPFPDIAPLGARVRAGEYSVTVGAAFQASAPAPRVESDLMEPPACLPEDSVQGWFYHFHGQPPVGPLLLSPSIPRYSATIKNVVRRDGERTDAEFRLLLAPKTGAVDSVLVNTTEPVSAPWSWRIVDGNNQVVSVDPTPLGCQLLSLGTANPLAVAALAHDRTRSRWWKLRLVRPLEAPIQLEARASTQPLPLPIADHTKNAVFLLGTPSLFPALTQTAALRLAMPKDLRNRNVPLLQVGNAADVHGFVEFVQRTDEREVLRCDGLTRGPSTRNDSKSEKFYYGRQAAEMSLIPAPARSATPIVESAELVTVADLGDRKTCCYRFRVRRIGGLTLPIRLPADAQVLGLAVNGQELPAEVCPITVESQQVAFNIPIPTGTDWNRIEVLYSLTQPSWRLTTRLAAVAPRLPVEVPDIRQIWRMGPRVVPDSRAGLVRLPDGADSGWAPSISWLQRLQKDLDTDTDVESRAPNASKAGTAPPPRNLRQTLTGSGGMAQKPLVDTEALCYVGYGPNTPTGRESLHTLGLELVAFPGGSVLTTSRQLSIWRIEATGKAGLPSSIVDALEVAARYGRDPSGRFRTVNDWLLTASANPPQFLSRLGGDGPGWTSWQTVPDSADSEIRLVCTDHVAMVGWSITAVLSVFGLVLCGRLGRLGDALLLAWLGLSGIAVATLPPAWTGLAAGPFLAAIFIGLLSALLRRPPRKVKPSVLTSVPLLLSHAKATAATGAMVLLLAMPLSAAAPAPAIVYLLPGDPESTRVLVPPELLEKLDFLTEPRLVLNEVVFWRAAYQGAADDSGAAEFEAHYELASFVDEATVVLPLAEIRYREVLLDGAAAFPKSAGNDRVTIEIKKKGGHRLDLKFTAAVNGSGPDREIRFNIPEAAICQLDLTAPPGAQHIRAVNWRGAQNYGEPNRLRADLGRSRSVHVRWQQGASAGTAQVRVQEASIWDLQTSGSTLISVLDYKITQGAVNELRVLLPPGVDVSRLEVRPETATTATPSSWLRRWHIEPNQILHIDLQAALSGSVRIILECVPTRRLVNRPALQVPMALDTVDSEAYVALRLRGLRSAADFEKRGVADFAADTFLREVWRNLGAEKSPQPVSYAYRGLKKEAVFLRPLLTTMPPFGRANQDLIWWVDRSGAQVQGTVRCTAAAAPLTFLEWEIAPTVHVQDVRGLAVYAWIQSGNQLLVWLREAVPETVVVWNGVLARPFPAAENMIFDVPLSRFESANYLSTIIRLRAPPDWTVNHENLPILGTAVPPLAPGELGVQLFRANSPVRFQLGGPQPDGSLRMLTVAEVVERRLELATTLEPQWRHDRPHSVAISLNQASNWKLQWQLPPGVQLISYDRGVSRREWVIEVPAGDVQRQPIQVRLIRALDSREDLVIPKLTCQAGVRPERIRHDLLLIGPELRLADDRGWRNETDAIRKLLPQQSPDLERWRQRGGSLWRSAARDPDTYLEAAPVPLDSARVRLLVAEIQAAHTRTGWVYRGRFNLLNEANASLRIEFPPSAVWESLAIDGVIQPIPKGFGSIALGPEPGSRTVHLVWSAPGPSWEIPRFWAADQPIQAPALLWTAIAPFDRRYENIEPISSAHQDLLLAESLFRAAADCEDFGARARARLIVNALQALNTAETSLSGPRQAERAAERGSNGLTLGVWAARLREQGEAARSTLSREALAEASLPADEETNDRLPHADAFADGVPVHWVETTVNPHVIVASTSLSLPRFGSVSLIALFIAVLGILIFVVGYYSRPEQVVVIGLLGFVVFGAPAGYCLLPIVLLGLAVRLAWMSRHLLHWAVG